MIDVKDILQKVNIFYSENLENNKFDSNIIFFLRVFYIWNFFHLLTLTPYSALIFGETSLISTFDFDQGNIFDWLFRFLVNDAYTQYYSFFVWGALISLVYLLSSPKSLIALVLYYFLIINLHNKAYVILDGGNNLQELLLVYSVFMALGFTLGSSRIGISLRNTALLISRLQICFLYLTACLSKFTGPMWQKGVGLYYSLSLSNYSNPFLSNFILDSDWLLVLGNYYTLVFQLLFSFFIWNYKTRNWIIVMGMFLHLQISIVMGLFFFGMMMITSYSLFSNHLPLEATILKSNSMRERIMNFLKMNSLFLIPQQLLINMFRFFRREKLQINV